MDMDGYTPQGEPPGKVSRLLGTGTSRAEESHRDNRVGAQSQSGQIICFEMSEDEDEPAKLVVAKAQAKHKQCKLETELTHSSARTGLSIMYGHRRRGKPKKVNSDESNKNLVSEVRTMRRASRRFAALDEVRDQATGEDRKPKKVIENRNSSSMITPTKPTKRPPPCDKKEAKDLLLDVNADQLQLSVYDSWEFIPKNTMMKPEHSFARLNYCPYLEEIAIQDEVEIMDQMRAKYFPKDSTFGYNFHRCKDLVFNKVEDMHRIYLKDGGCNDIKPSTEKKVPYKLNCSDLAAELRLRPEFLKAKLLVDCPPDHIFKAAYVELKIKDKYYRSGIKDQFIQTLLARSPEKYISPKLDALSADLSVSEDREVALSLEHLFCRRCLSYNCQLHVELPFPPVFVKKLGPATDPATIKCENACFSSGRVTSGPRIQSDELNEMQKGLAGAIAPMPPPYPSASASWEIPAQIRQIFDSSETREHRLLANTIREEKPAVIEDEDKSSSDGSKDGKCKSKTTRRQPDNPKHPVKEICYAPCLHPGVSCTQLTDCDCKVRGTYCEKFCTCGDDCANRFKGCNCAGTCLPNRSRGRQCPCFEARRECDPDLCRSCGAHEFQADKVRCRNVGIQRGSHKHLLWAESTLDVKGIGWGIFANELIRKKEFIYEYTGELIDHREADCRGLLYDNKFHTFLFQLNDELLVDATYFGNKMRFANHNDRPNCTFRVMKVNGDHRVGIYATRDIQPEEELFLYYPTVLKKHEDMKQAREQCQNGIE